MFFFFRPTSAFSNIICLFLYVECMGSYSWKTAGWEYFPKPDAMNQRKTSNSLARFSLSVSITFTHFYSRTHLFVLVALSTSRLIVSWLLRLFYSTAAPCHTPSVLISPDQNPRSNQDDRSLLPLSLSIKDFVVPAGENAAFADAAVSFTPFSQFFC